MINTHTPIPELVFAAHCAPLKDMFKGSGRSIWKHQTPYAQLIPAVYWIESDGEVVYVGQTKRGVRNRLRWHAWGKQSPAKSTVRNGGNVFWVSARKSELDQVEAKLIRHFQPRLNRDGI